MAKAKSLITPIRGYTCNVCGMQMVGVSEEEALEHARVPVDKPFQKRFAYVAWTIKEDYSVRIIIGPGKLSQDREGTGVHGYEQDTASYSVWGTEIVPREVIPINTRQVRIDFRRGISRLLTTDEATFLEKFLKKKIRRTDPSLEARTK